MPVLEFAFALVDGNLAVVHFHVLHESPPVLDPFLDHTKANNESQRRDHADGGEGAHRGEREDGGEEEVEVGDAAELLEDGLGEEGEDVVLGRGDVVGRVLERLPAVHGGVVAVDDAREPRAADGAAARGGGPAADGLVVAVGGAEAGEGVELAPSQAVAPPPAGTAHTGSRLSTSRPPIPARRSPALAPHPIKSAPDSRRSPAACDLEENGESDCDLAATPKKKFKPKQSLKVNGEIPFQQKKNLANPRGETTRKLHPHFARNVIITCRNHKTE